MDAPTGAVEEEQFGVTLTQQPTYAQVEAAKGLLELEAERPRRGPRELAILRAIAEATPSD